MIRSRYDWKTQSGVFLRNRLIAVALVFFVGIVPVSAAGGDGKNSEDAIKTMFVKVGREKPLIGRLSPGTPAKPTELPDNKLPENNSVFSTGAPAAEPDSLKQAAGTETTQAPAPAVEPLPVRKKTVSGWLPFWDTDEGLRAVREFPQTFTDISPFWFRATADGGITGEPGSDNGQTIAALREQSKQIIPTISIAEKNIIGPVLADPQRRSAHADAIVNLTVSKNYDGIDIDYEKVEATDRDAFSAFIGELAEKLHRRRKYLIVTVYAKTAEPGGWNGPQSHDYAAIGRAADQVRIMAYDKHYAGGPAGPVAPIGWVEQVLAFAVSAIDKNKVVLGVPAYGYNWPASGSARSVVHDDAAALSQQKQTPIQWDAGAASPFFRYTDESGEHTVWFENNQSLSAKFALAKRYDIGGISVWRLGREDKTAYRSLNSIFLSP